jgi:hypothetical protein
MIAYLLFLCVSFVFASYEKVPNTIQGEIADQMETTIQVMGQPEHSNFRCSFCSTDKKVRIVDLEHQRLLCSQCENKTLRYHCLPTCKFSQEYLDECLPAAGQCFGPFFAISIALIVIFGIVALRISSYS